MRSAGRWSAGGGGSSAFGEATTFYADPTGKKRLSIPVHAGESLKRGLLARLLKESGLRLEDIE